MCFCHERRWRYSARKVTSGLVEINGSLPPVAVLQSLAGWLPVHRDQLRAQGFEIWFVIRLKDLNLFVEIFVIWRFDLRFAHHWLLVMQIPVIPGVDIGATYFPIFLVYLLFNDSFSLLVYTEDFGYINGDIISAATINRL